MDYVRKIKSYFLNKINGKRIWKDSGKIIWEDSSYSYPPLEESLCSSNGDQDNLSQIGDFYDSFTTFSPGASPLATRHHIGSGTNRAEETWRRRTLSELERDPKKPLLLKASVQGCIWKPVRVCQDIQATSSDEEDTSSDEEDTCSDEDRKCEDVTRSPARGDAYGSLSESAKTFRTLPATKRVPPATKRTPPGTNSTPPVTKRTPPATKRTPPVTKTASVEMLPEAQRGSKNQIWQKNMEGLWQKNM